jgi:hypothetical protein
MYASSEMHEEYTMSQLSDTTVTLATLKAAKEKKNPNYREIADIALYLMMSGLEPDARLKACFTYAWAIEAMGEWEKALDYYRLLEAQEKPAVAAYMVTHQVWVLYKLNKVDAARELLDSLVRDLNVRVPEAQHPWVQGKIGLLIKKLDEASSNASDD